MEAVMPPLLATPETVANTDAVFYMMGAITAVFLVGITGLMIYFTIRYSRKRHPKAEQVEKNTLLEVSWIVIPTFIVLYMFWRGYEGFELLRNPPPDAMEINVRGHQWLWTFTYPEVDVASGELWVPVNRAVKLNLRSDDVIHSLYLPAFRVKEDAVPGYDTFLWFKPDRIDTYDIFCAEYCGKDHSRMITKLHVVSEADYQKWLKNQVELRYRPITMEDAMNPETPSVKEVDAHALFNTYCISCHGPNGEGGLVEKARNFHKIEGWTRSPKAVDIFRTLSEGSPGTQMRPFPNLTTREKLALAWFVRKFYQGPDQPKSTEDEWKKLVETYKLDEQRSVSLDFPVEAAIDKLSSGEHD